MPQTALDKALSVLNLRGVSDHANLTKEIADQFLADEDSVDISEFTSI